MADDVKSRTAQMFDVMSSSYDAIVPFFAEFGELLVAAAGSSLAIERSMSPPAPAPA